jgi:hypothetical protein
MRHDTDTLDLTTLEGLNEEVTALFKDLSACIEQGDKASIGITIGLERVKDTNSLFSVTYKVKPSYPARGKQVIAHADLIGNLTVDAAMPISQRSVLENA